MKRLPTVVVLGLFGLMLSRPTATAYPLYHIGTQIRGQTWSWEYSGRGSDGQPYTSQSLSAERVRTMIVLSFDSFSSGMAKDSRGQACSTLTFDDRTGAEPSRYRATDGDGRNVHGVMITLRSDPLYRYVQGGVLAFASPTSDSDGYVADCDTVYNAVDFEWGADGEGDEDLQMTAMQETAHCFGLHHVCEQSAGDGQPPCDGPDVEHESVMFPFAAPGTGSPTPTLRDQDNMCQIYPVTGIGRPCDAYSRSTRTGFDRPDCAGGTACACTAVGAICTRDCDAQNACPDTAECVDGKCVPDLYPGTRSTGMATRTAIHCGPNIDGGVRVGAGCGADADCGSGATCLTQIPGGLCTISCLTSMCPYGSTCTADMLTAGDAWCLRDCTLNTTTCASPACETGQQCQTYGGSNDGVCWKPCLADTDCDQSGSSTYTCDIATKTCRNRRSSTPTCGVGSRNTGTSTCVPRCQNVVCGGGDGCGGACTGPEVCPGTAPSTPTAPETDQTGSGCGCTNSGPVSAVLWMAGIAMRRRRRTS